MTRRTKIFSAVGLAVLVAAAGLYATVRPRVIAEFRRARLDMRLDSADADERIRTAWSLAENPDPFLIAKLVQKIMGDESDAGAREAYVYTLGRMANPLYLGAIRYATEGHEAGPVRAAAWLALARTDKAEFKKMAESGGNVGDDWDEIGLAQGWLVCGDFRGVATLLRFVTDDNEDKRYACSQSLWKHIRPLMDATGRWPIAPAVVEGQPWPIELSREVSKRAAAMNLEGIRADTRPHLQATESLRQTVRRLTAGRERVVRWLYSESVERDANARPGE